MASLDHEMTVILEMKPSPAMREFAKLIVRETIRQAEDLDDLHNAVHSDIFAKDLEGRTIKIESSALSVIQTKVTFADTGEEIPDIRRAEISLDAQTGEMNATLYRYTKVETPMLEYAVTRNVGIATLVSVKGT